MNAHTETPDIATVVETNPVSVLVDEKLYERFYNRCKAEVDEFVPDLTTETSRKAIASLAYKVTRTKTAIDGAGKKLNEDARAQINAVDARRRIVREEFDALAKRARKPLDEWEVAEDARVERCMAVLKAIEDCGNGLIGGEPQPFGILLHELENAIVIDDTLGEFEEQARIAHDVAVEKVKAAQAEQERQAAIQAELDQLRAEKAERERKDAEKAEAERLAAIAKEKAEREAVAAAERERLAKEKAEIEAAEQAARDERIAQEARETAEREAQEKIDEANRRAQEAIDAANEERRRIQETGSAETYDRAHRAKVLGRVLTCLMTHGLDQEVAEKIVADILDGEIPHVRIEF